jgi:hypothetical protein
VHQPNAKAQSCLQKYMHEAKKGKQKQSSVNMADLVLMSSMWLSHRMEQTTDDVERGLRDMEATRKEIAVADLDKLFTTSPSLGPTDISNFLAQEQTLSSDEPPPSKILSKFPTLMRKIEFKTATVKVADPIVTKVIGAGCSAKKGNSGASTDREMVRGIPDGQEPPGRLAVCGFCIDTGATLTKVHFQPSSGPSFKQSRSYSIGDPPEPDDRKYAFNVWEMAIQRQMNIRKRFDEMLTFVGNFSLR